MCDYVDISTPDGVFQAFIARPTDDRVPVVVVLQELFGINDDMKATCRELAARGYIAVCPDLFWRQEPGVSLSAFSDADWARGMALYQTFDIDKGVADIASTIAAARTMSGASGMVGVMGYCLGGLMTVLTAARTPVDAAVAYYPGGADQYAPDLAGIAAPIVVHLGTEDEFITAEAQATIEAALAPNPAAATYVYPGQSHAFARHGGAHYNRAAADLANGRTWAHLRTHLSPGRRDSMTREP